MNHDNWRPAWTRCSKLEDIVWITKDVLAWCSGVFIVFFGIDHGDYRFHWCWNHHTGDGARCLSAHKSLAVFAFAEKVIQPRILVFSYPTMTKIAECAGGCASGYLATAFTPGDHLVSVGSYPMFVMTVWNWRTGEKIISVNTFIRDEVGQILRITRVGPTVVGQLGKTCGRLYTWELDVVGKVAIVKDYEIKLPKDRPILWIDWNPTSTEPLLAITDVDGHIFLSNFDGSSVNRIVLSTRCGVCTDVELPMAAWFRDGIVLRTTFCQIRFFSRSQRTSSWRMDWYVKLETKPYILAVHPSDDHRFFYYTLEGHLMQIGFTEKDETPRAHRYIDYGATCRYADFVYPWCHHLVVSCDTRKELIVVECYEGTPIASVDLETDGEIVCQVSHPDFPLVVLGTEKGEVIFVTFTEPTEPGIAARVRLQRTPIDLIKFSNTGRFLIAAERKTGDCYCVSLEPGKMYTARTLIRVHRRIIDLLVYEGYRKLRILVLYETVKQHNVGQILLLYEASPEQNLVTDSMHMLKLPGVYRALYQVPGNPMLLVGSPYSTRQLRLQKVVDFRHVVLEDGLATGHQVKLANLFVDRSWISTTALDGFVLIRDRTVRRVAAHVIAHHRSDLGTIKAMANRQGDLIVCLGYNGSLIAIKSIVSERKEFPQSKATSSEEVLYKAQQGVYEKMRKKIQSDYASLDPAVYELLTRRKYKFPDPRQGDKTWSDWREEIQLREEEEKSREERTTILREFEALQGKVRKLLDANEASPEIEKLPVSFFDLDLAGRDQKLKAGRDICEDLHLELEHNIAEMQRVSRWIREAFWNPQAIVGKCLYAILGTMLVTNYPEFAEEPDEKHHLQWAKFCKKTAYSSLENGEFAPWRIFTAEELQVELNKKQRLPRELERRLDLLVDDDDQQELEQEKMAIVEADLEERKAMGGTTAHRYIEESPYYAQIGYYGFGQTMINNHLLLHDCKRLRAFFNQAFNEVYATKEREMKVIRERIDRIRYIDSELRTMFHRHVPHIPVDPQWHWQERPESIIKVLDHEVKAKRYISQSQQELLDKQAAEEERIRQLLLADDFRERALMAMMDGVLEVRWEDTIKIDVPKPACMLEKKPEDYTSEDISAVKQYENDVQFLMEERERYKRMLEAEYGRVMELLKEGIDKFNDRLNDLFHLKINVEAAINQLHLRYIRGWILIRRRMQSLQEEDKLKQRVLEKEKYQEVLNSHLDAFRELREEMAAKHRSFVAKEKAVAKKFRSEFASLNKFQVELLAQQYNRRPKITMRSLVASDVYELASHVTSRLPCVYLSTECKDYLRILNHLDVRPAVLPATIDASHWDDLIRLRRVKIDFELRSKAQQIEIADADAVILGFEQRIEKCKTDAEDMRRSLIELRDSRRIEELDVEMQLVLKMGQVEIQLAGEVNDAQNAVLVSKTAVESVNELIRAAGACKLNALSRLLSFQRGTLLKQWEHECQKNKLQDLEEDLRSTESVTVTKEMQRYLKRKARGLPDEKTPQQLEDDVNAVKRQFSRILEDHQARLRSIENEIAAVRSKNEQLDRQILEMNMARCEMEQKRDLIGEARQREHMERKLRMVMHRSELIKKLQDNYAELIELQTEHELLRLRRYPTFHFRMLDDSDGERKKD
ncbi:cilia- and flagella-associated protein 43-like [Frieseomelitta varia]|uniref:cilia- and flagella-associated protein 43-like n=1 Tax=Frieseomelitta varia TaxID=561572 RepID=UPI001CB69A0E|nr:cilia- and flagella-associated protein 43-like [Frieseomelitta varia]